jgi:hypothetical protein
VILTQIAAFVVLVAVPVGAALYCAYAFFQKRHQMAWTRESVRGLLIILAIIAIYTMYIVIEKQLLYAHLPLMGLLTVGCGMLFLMGKMVAVIKQQNTTGCSITTWSLYETICVVMMLVSIWGWKVTPESASFLRRPYIPVESLILIEVPQFLVIAMVYLFLKLRHSYTAIAYTLCMGAFLLTLFSIYIGHDLGEYFLQRRQRNTDILEYTILFWGTLFLPFVWWGWVTGKMIYSRLTHKWQEKAEVDSAMLFLGGSILCAFAYSVNFSLKEDVFIYIALLCSIAALYFIFRNKRIRHNIRQTCPARIYTIFAVIAFAFSSWSISQEYYPMFVKKYECGKCLNLPRQLVFYDGFYNTRGYVCLQCPDGRKKARMCEMDLKKQYSNIHHFGDY